MSKTEFVCLAGLKAAPWLYCFAAGQLGRCHADGDFAHLRGLVDDPLSWKLAVGAIARKVDKALF
jgi:hypothetical protein